MSCFLRNFNPACLSIAMGLILITPQAVTAAPAAPHRGCELVGEIVKIEERVVERDKSWAESWDIATTKSYTDVTITPLSVTHEKGSLPKSCTGEVQTFQLPQENNSLQKGDCLRAKVRFSGDEFSIGTWLTKVSKVSCQKLDNGR